MTGFSISIVDVAALEQVGVPVVPTTFDPANKSANITLSGGNLVATSTSTPVNGNSVCTIRSQTSGAYYFETAATTLTGVAGNFGVGLANATFPIAADTFFLGGDANSIGYYDSGFVTLNALTVATIATFVQGSVIGVAYNKGVNRIWFRVGAGGWNNNILANQNPATNTGGIDISAIVGAVFPAICLSVNADVATANFGATAFANAAPAGYGNP